MDQQNLQQLYYNVELLEKKLAEYTGAPYAVCVDSCTSALFLCFKYDKTKKISIPKDTYVGVAMAALHANKEIDFTDIKWQGVYQLYPTLIYDAAKRFTKNMYIKNTLMCLSFHYKKHLKIGRGGAILTDNKEAAEWFKLARNCGKNINDPMPQQKYSILGLNMLMHPDLALKGLELFEKLNDVNDDLPYEHYGDLSIQMKDVL